MQQFYDLLRLYRAAPALTLYIVFMGFMTGTVAILFVLHMLGVL